MTTRSSLAARILAAFSDETDIRETLSDLRRQLERVFSPDTAAPGFSGHVASTGHCAAVSVVLSKLLGATMVSTRIGGQSHWFNRMRFGEKEYDFDLTGDQYEFRRVEFAPAGQLYPETRVRLDIEVNDETIRRAILFAERADFTAVANALRCRLNERQTVLKACSPHNPRT